MKNKVLAIVIALTLLAGIIPAGAASDEAVFEVISMGIVRGDENGDLKLGDDVTRGEFATMVVRLLGYEDLASGRETVFYDVPASHIHSGAISLISDLGFISGDGTGAFNPDNPVKVQDCLKILVHAVGYELAANSKGGYPSGYIGVANELHLTKKVERGLTQNATRGDVVSMIYYALQVNLLESGYRYDGEYKKSGETLKDRMSFREDIHLAKGIVTANYDTWLVMPVSDIEENEIEIDGTRYVSGNINTSALLGRLVEVYYREEVSGKKTVLNIALSTKNREAVIESDDFDSITDSEIIYHDENYRKHSVDIAPNAVFLYNNRVMTEYTDDELFLTQGRYECVDNNMDKLYDYVFIYDYESSVVDRVNLNGCIYLKNEVPVGGRNYIVLDDEDDNFNYRLRDAQGNEIFLEDIEKDDVVTVYRSLDGTYAEVVVSDKKVTGKIEEINDDGDIVIGGELFGKSSGINEDKLLLGNSVVAFVNEFGKVVYLMEDEGKSYKYGFITDYAKEGFSGYTVKILVSGSVTNTSEVDENSEDLDLIPVLVCQNSEVVIAELNQKISFNGDKVAAEAAMESLNGNLPVKFELDDDGKVRSIEELDINYGSTTVKMNYNAKEKIFGGISGITPFGVNADTKVICVPTNIDADDEDILTQIKIDNRDASVKYLASGYELDEDSKCVKLLVVRADMISDTALNITKNSDIGFVQHSFVTVDEFGDELRTVTVLSGSEEIKLIAKEVSGDNGDTDYLKNGDFIIYETNNEGYLVNSKIIKSLSGKYSHNMTDSGSVSGSITGIVTDIKRLEINNEDSKRIHILEIQAGRTLYSIEVPARLIPDFYVYDKQDKKAIVGSIDDVMHGDSVCIALPEENVKDCVIVRGE